VRQPANNAAAANGDRPPLIPGHCCTPGRDQHAPSSSNRGHQAARSADREYSATGPTAPRGNRHQHRTRPGLGQSASRPVRAMPGHATATGRTTDRCHAQAPINRQQRPSAGRKNQQRTSNTPMPRRPATLMRQAERRQRQRQRARIPSPAAVSHSAIGQGRCQPQQRGTSIGPNNGADSERVRRPPAGD